MSKIVANSQQEVVKSIIGSEEKIEKPCYIKEMGNYNHLPEPWEECDLGQALSMIVSYTPIAVEFRQVYTDQKTIRSVKIFYFYNCAYGIMHVDHEFKDGKYEYKFKAVRIGCKHQNSRETKLGKSYYKVTCPDCGLEYEYDCSD